jgi:hypothetical protein
VIYPNGESFNGSFNNDKRIGRGTMSFLNGCEYKGQFIND